MIDRVVTDLIEQTRRQHRGALRPQSIDDVRALRPTLVAMSRWRSASTSALKRFLNEHLYRHEKKLAMMTDA